MELNVNSKNRGAVRKYCVSAGHPAAEVRSWPIGILRAEAEAALAQLDDEQRMLAIARLNDNGDWQHAATDEGRDGQQDGSNAEARQDNSSNDDDDESQSDDGSEEAEESQDDEQADEQPGDDGEDNQSETQQPPPQQEEQPGTIEDIIRRIAREEDSPAWDTLAEHEKAIAEAAKTGGKGGNSGVVRIKVADKPEYKSEGVTHECFETVLTCLANGENVWLKGPAGSGKTYLAAQGAEALDRAFYSTGAIHSKYDLIGFVTPNGDIIRTPFRDAFERGGVFLFDEIDASDPRAVNAFNQALANGSYAFPDGMVHKHDDFVCIAAANTSGKGATSEYVGRFRIDAASLDRFFEIEMLYDDGVEFALSGGNTAWLERVQDVRRAVEALGIDALITPRATEKGAKLLAAKMPKCEVESGLLFKGLSDDDRSRINQWIKDNPANSEAA